MNLLITNVLMWPHIAYLARERKREREREGEPDKQTETGLEEGEFSTVGNLSFYQNCGIFLYSC